MLGSGGVLILASCAWLTRFDLDLLAFLLAATYSSVLVCLSLVQSNLEGYPGSASLPSSKSGFFFSDVIGPIVLGTVAINTAGEPGFSNFFNDFAQAEADWFEQVIAVFHLFFYRTAAFEAVLLNLFLLLALIASLAIATSLSVTKSFESPTLSGASRIRLVRSFRRQIRRKNSSQVRSAKK